MFIIINRKKIGNMINLVKALPYIITTFMPIVWYLTIRQHSYQHMWFAYRNTLLLMIGIPLTLLNLLEIKRFPTKKDIDV